MPGGGRKKKTTKGSGKKNKNNRSRSANGESTAEEIRQPLPFEHFHLEASDTEKKVDTDIEATSKLEVAEYLTQTSSEAAIPQEHILPQEEEEEEEENETSKVTIQIHDGELSFQTPVSPKRGCQDKRITELNMQVEQLTADVEKYRTRCYNLEANLQSHCAAQHANEEMLQIQIRTLTEKLTNANIKLCECRNYCQQQKQELKLAHKALSNEVGDGVCIQHIVSGMSTWRGRAQQILTLQQKVSDLQDQLQAVSTKDSMPHTVLENIASERERRTAQENVERQLREKMTELDEVRKRLEGSRARNKVLETEITSLKSTAATLLEKGKHDDQLISALTVETKKLERKLKEYQESEVAAADRLEDEQQRFKKELTQERTKSSQLQVIVMQKEDALRILEEKLSHIREKQNIYDQEKTHLQFLNDTHQHSSQNTCIKNKDEVDYYQKTCLAAEGERIKLLELLAVYNKRLDEQQKKANDAEENLRRERQKSARLETKLARLELEKAAAFKATYSFRARKHSPQKASIIPQEIQDRLELLQEQNLALRTRLKCLKQDKDDDLKMFTKLLSNRQRDKPIDKSSHCTG